MKLDGVPLYLDVTLCCGQVFRWDKKGEWWYGVASDRAFKVRQANAEETLSDPPDVARDDDIPPLPFGDRHVQPGCGL